MCIQYICSKVFQILIPEFLCLPPVTYNIVCFPACPLLYYVVESFMLFITE